MKITVNVEKTIQETPYEPYKCSLTAEADIQGKDHREKFKQLHKSLEDILDDIILKRLEKMDAFDEEEEK